MERLKIALVSDWYYPKVGGIEYVIDSLAKNLIMQGHEVHIITRQYSSFNDYQSIKKLTVIRLKGKELTPRLMGPTTYKHLYNVLKNGNYDIINSHGLDSPLAIMALIIANKIKVPAVITNHSLAGNDLVHVPLYIAGNFFLRYADAIIAVSSSVEKESKRMSKISKPPIYVIHNGVDIVPPKKEQCIINFKKNDRIVITTVSRMTHKKRVESIINIAPDIIRKYPNALFLMIGSGPLKSKLEGKVSKEHLENNFFFTDAVPRETVFALLNESDIFLMPSKKEAFGVAALEAFSKKLPVIAFKSSGVSDIIVHGKTGFLVYNDQELAKYIEILIQNQNLRLKIGNNAYQELNKYKWNDITKQIIDLYSLMIHENHSNYN